MTDNVKSGGQNPSRIPDGPPQQSCLPTFERDAKEMEAPQNPFPLFPARQSAVPKKSPSAQHAMLKFSFCTCGGIPATPPIDSEEIAANRRATQLAASCGLEYRWGADLTRLSRYVYPYLEGEDFVCANNWHCCLWVLDNHLDGTDAPLEEKLELLRRLHSELEKIASRPSGESPRAPPGPQPTEALKPQAAPLETPKSPAELAVMVGGTAIRSSSSFEATAGAFAGLLDAALQPVLRRLGPRLQQHMVAQVADYFRGVEDHLLCNEDTLTSDEYAAIRAADSAYETVWPLMYLGLGDILDLGEACARGLRRRANQCGRIINDVYSVPKDRAVGMRFNAVFVLARELEISDAQAEQILIARANKLFRELPGTGKFSGFRIWCAGAAVWHDGAERYRHVAPTPTKGQGHNNEMAQAEAKPGVAPHRSLAAALFSGNACPEISPVLGGNYSGQN